MPGLRHALLSTLLPARCGQCGETLGVGFSAGVCTSCWESIVPHDGEICPLCGRPDLAEPDPCLSCRDEPPIWKAAATLGPYSGVLRDLVLLLKQGHRDELAGPLGDLLAQLWASTGWPRPEAVVGVPMHWWRRWRRGFNQAELLARTLASRLGVLFTTPLRRHAGAPQVGRARSERLRLSSRRLVAKSSITGSILLVDDVLTTGATAAACTRALRRAGATDVRVLALARTPDPRSLA